MGHDVQNRAVCLFHSLGTDTREVVDATVYIVFDEPFHIGYIFVLDGQHGTEYCGGNSARHFQRATGLGAIANHTGQIGNHILHAIDNLVIVATHQIGDAATASGAGNHTTAKCTETSQTLFDIDGCQMAQYQGSCQFLFRIMIFPCKDHYRQSGGYSLIAAAAVAHNGNHGPGHSCVTGATGGGKDVAEDAVTHYTLSQRTAQCLSQFVAIVAFKGFIGGLFIQDTCLVDEFQKFQRGIHGKIVNLAQIQTVFHIDALAALETISFIGNDIAVVRKEDQTVMFMGDNGLCIMLTGTADDIHIKIVAGFLFQFYTDDTF